MHENHSPRKLLDPHEVDRGQALLVGLKAGLSRALIGQERLIELCIIALAARGNLLLEGLPGLGKTELVKAMGALLDLDFSRVQFTPDLLPGDITGGPVLQESEGQRSFVFQKGPIFAHLVLADEINRASPKTQSALLEAMQEHRVTVLGESHALPDPFFVLATQNPIELEGTYPLPEAQLDRFLFKVEVPGVGADVLETILLERRRGQAPALEPVMDRTRLQELFDLVDEIYLPEAVARYTARLVSATHPGSAEAPAEFDGCLRYGASPRAAIALGEAGRASALLAGRPNVDFSDIEQLARPVLAHRLVLDHRARIEGRTPAQLVDVLVRQLSPVSEALEGGRS